MLRTVSRSRPSRLWVRGMAGQAGRANAERGSSGQRHRREVEQNRRRYDEADGYYKGTIVASLGRQWQVELSDGRVCKAKAAGRLTKPDLFQPLRVGNVVTVRYAVEEDEDAQTPMIVQRESLTVSAPPLKD